MHPALFHSSSPSQGHKTFDGHLRTYAAAYIHRQVGKPFSLQKGGLGEGKRGGVYDCFLLKE